MKDKLGFNHVFGIPDTLYALSINLYISLHGGYYYHHRHNCGSISMFISLTSTSIYEIREGYV